MSHQDIDQVIGKHTGLSRKVLEYSQTMKALVDAAKQPAFAEARWDELADAVDTATFERVGNFMEVMDWPTYRGFLHGWAQSSDWDCSFKRISENGNVVLLELEERSRVGEASSTVNSASVYEFDHAGKIRHLDIYLQMPLPDPAMFASYEGIDIAG